MPMSSRASESRSRVVTQEKGVGIKRFEKDLPERETSLQLPCKDVISECRQVFFRRIAEMF